MRKLKKLQQKLNLKNNIQIFPNPASSTLNIKAEGNTITEIYDINGRKVMTSANKSIDIHHLGSGFYTVKIINSKNNSTVTSHKLIKQ